MWSDLDGVDDDILGVIVMLGVMNLCNARAFGLWIRTVMAAVSYGASSTIAQVLTYASGQTAAHIFPHSSSS